MADAPERTRSAPASSGGGWWSNLPDWMRWAIPVMLVFAVIGVVAIVGAVVSEPSDPEDQAQSLCLDAVSDDLESRGNTVEDLPLFNDVEEVDDTEYRAQGSVIYVEDGETVERTVRCVVRVDEDGDLSVASIRFGGG